MHVPGCYCAGCGESFALYSYSAIQPTEVDENGKPYYKDCFKCNDPEGVPAVRTIH